MSHFIDREAVDDGHGGDSDRDVLYTSDEESNSDIVDESDEDINSLYRSVKRKRSSQALNSDSENEVQSRPSKKKKVSQRQKSNSNSSQRCESGIESNAGATNLLMDEVKRSNKILLSLVSRVKKTEKRLKDVEEQLKKTPDNSSPGSTPRRVRQKDVPEEVRRETRRVYNLLLDEDAENFSGWKIETGVTYRDSHNQAVLDRLVREVKALNPVFLNLHIKDAAYRFYRSRCEEISSKRRGKHVGKVQMKRRHQRKLTKLNERKAMFAKGSFKDGGRDLEQWKAILTLDVMSSDESGEDEGEEVLIVHPIPWLSHTVTQFKLSLDQQIALAKTPQAKRQMKKRVLGCPSTRGTVDTLPSWALKE